MILQELVRYCDRQRDKPDSDIAPPGWIRRSLDYIVVLNCDGMCLDFISNFTLLKGKSVGNTCLLPAIGKQALKHTNSGKDANLLWDNASFVFGIADRRGTKLQSFIDTVHEWLPQTEDIAVRAVVRFLESLQADANLAEQLIEKYGAKEDFDKRDPTIAFRFLGDGPINVHERADVRSVYGAGAREGATTGPRGQCLITGETGVVLAMNEMVIKNVWGAQSAGANLVSFNKSSFISFGKQDRNGENAPVSAKASTAYSVALNHLLTSTRNRVQVGDTSTVFWADGPSQFDGEHTLADFFGESKDDPDRGVRAVSALYEALKSGSLPVGDADVQFFVLGLAPNAARISIRFWLRARFSELAPRIRQHFDDLKVVRRFDSDPLTPSLYRLLRGIALLDKIENVPPRLAGEWMRAILEGQAYPATLLNAVIIRCKAEQAARDAKSGKRVDNVSYIRAAILKAWLNRFIRLRQLNEKEFHVALDPTNINVAYRLGRLFAAYEQVQAEAAGRELNRSIRDAFFSSAMSTPATAFPRLVQLNQHHLRDLRRTNVGLHIKRDRLLTEIAGGIDASLAFPRTLPLQDQARFALGYYHQRQAFFPRKDESSNNKPAQEN